MLTHYFAYYSGHVGIGVLMTLCRVADKLTKWNPTAPDSVSWNLDVRGCVLPLVISRNRLGIFQ